MVVRKVLVVIIVAVLVLVAIGGGYILLSQKSSTSKNAPTVTSTSPVQSDTGTAINAKILATFSKVMDSTTLSTSTFSLKHGTTSEPGAVTYTGVTAIFAPTSYLATSTTYTATITTGVKDSSGHAMAVNFVWSFTTGLYTDTTQPTVVSTSPVTSVLLNGNISVTFSEPMDPSTIDSTTFTVMQGTTPITGTVTYSGRTAIFTPTSNLAVNTSYTATITTGANDLAGNALMHKFVWSFTTSNSSSVAGQSPVALGSAGDFAVLAGSTVTNTGATTVTGDLGVSPGSAITGFPPGIVIGAMHSADGAAAEAQAKLTIAYNYAAGLTLNPITVSGNLGGLTLTPGIYKSTSGLEVSSGDLTLNAQGDANGVFIFQMASTLGTASGLHVILADGAKASNVFWQVGSSATLGTNSVFVGTIMADQSIALNTGATLIGRALARIGAVTLDTSVVTAPAPSVTSTSPSVSVALNGNILATFSQAMDPSTINTTTFTLKHGTTPVLGTVTYTGLTAIFDPTNNLAASTTYTVTITTGAKDLEGNAMASDFVWNFTTGATPDTTAPTVSSTFPANHATGAAINRAISASFSEPMNPTTLTTTTFTLKQGSTSVSGKVSYAGVVATFTPTAVLATYTLYTVTVTTGAKDLAGNDLASDYVWSFTTGAVPDTTAPTVSSTVPANGATGVAVNRAVTATFSEQMDPLTVTMMRRGYPLTFTLKQGLTTQSGTVTYAGTTATFVSESVLAMYTPYTAMITTLAKDLAGNALAHSYSWNFTTGGAPDITPPRVSYHVPASGATGVAINNAISASFDEAMDPLTITTTTFTLKHGTSAVLGAVSYVGFVAVFTPAANLSEDTMYVATITTGARDLAGNGLTNNYAWNFTTGNTSDTTAPTVSYPVPANHATGVPVNRAITATFSEAMDPLTLTTTTFTLKHGITPVSGTVTYSGLTATFNQASDLAVNTTYTATITTGAQDLAGNALVSNFVWTFSTLAPAALGPAAVNLGTAGDFVILAKSGVSTTGTTAIVGDIGLSPAATSFITGFGLIMDSSNTFATSSLVTGQIKAADMANPTPSIMTTAVNDMQLAFTDAAGRTNPDYTELGSGNIDGMTLAPGLYKWGTGVTIPIGVTLSGGPNDVWIFQIAQDLTVGNGAIVTLTGGAQAKNIFWQVSGHVVLGTTSDFKGIILCQTDIALQTGATLDGRALAQTAVTLDASTVTRP